MLKVTQLVGVCVGTRIWNPGSGNSLATAYSVFSHLAANTHHSKRRRLVWLRPTASSSFRGFSVQQLRDLHHQGKADGSRSTARVEASQLWLRTWVALGQGNPYSWCINPETWESQQHEGLSSPRLGVGRLSPFSPREILSRSPVTFKGEAYPGAVVSWACGECG